MNEPKIIFTDTSSECIALMRNYTKAGLKAGAKIVTKVLRNDIKLNHYKTGGLYKSISSKVEFDKKTGQPSMLVGYKSTEAMRKKGIKYFVNPYWFELGISAHDIATKEYVKSGQSSYELTDNKGTKYGVIVRHPGYTGKNLLRNTVYNHIEEIHNAQKEYLAKITDIQVVKGLIIDVGGDEDIDD